MAGKYTPGYSQKYAITGNDIMPFVGVFAVGIIIFVISLMMYKYRKSETVGDVVSFTWCKPVFRTVFSITGGVFWHLYFGLYDFIIQGYHYILWDMRVESLYMRVYCSDMCFNMLFYK